MELIPDMDIFLVLSSVTNNKTIEEIAKKYKFLDKCRLILTKTDESATLGVVVNAKFITGMSLSYITTGQSVPDDIEIVNTDKIIKNLIGSIIWWKTKLKNLGKLLKGCV